MRRQDKYPNTATFRYINLNPYNRITTDCVVRAIAMAMVSSAITPESSKEKLGKDIWFNVLYDLTKLSEELGYMPTDRKCYSEFLINNGFIEYPQPRHGDGTKYTLKEFIQSHPKGVYVVNMPTHLTVVVNGINYDIWDCSKSHKKIGNFWGKEDEVVICD